MKMKLFHVIATSLLGTAMALGTGFALANKQESRQARAETATMAPGTQASSGYTVNGKDAIKVGTSKKDGSMTITVGAGAKTFSFYAAAWSGNPGTITLSGATAGQSSFDLTADTGIASDPKDYTLNGNESDYYFQEITLSNITVETTITLSSGTARRFVVWGATYSTGGASLKNLVIKNDSDETGPFDDLNSKSVSGYEFFAYDADTGTQQSVTFSISDSTVATLLDNGDGSCKVTPIKSGSVTLFANLEGYIQKSASLTFVYPYEHAGDDDDPFTVEEALAKATELGKTEGGPFAAKGIVTRITSAPAATYWNATFYISDDGSQTNELQVYRCLDVGNKQFTEDWATYFKVGKLITVHGKLTGNYGSEFCQGSYLLSIEDPSTGDIDITFDPTTNLEIGNTGSFVASTTATNPTYTWEVEDSSILSVNASTGAYEALKLGVTKVTVNVSATEGNGSASAFITVNGSANLSVSDVLGMTITDGTTTGYYVYVQGYVKAFGTSQTSEATPRPRALDIADSDGTKIMVYTGPGTVYEDWIDGLSLGDLVRVRANIQSYNSKLQLANPVRMSKEYVAMSLAYELLSRTDSICEDYDDVTDNGTAIAGIWETLAGEGFYGALSPEQKEVLANADADEHSTNVLEQAMARYDYLTKKYKLSNWIVGRTIKANRNSLTPIMNVNNTVMMVVIISSVVVAVSLAGVFFIIRRRKHQ